MLIISFLKMLIYPRDSNYLAHPEKSWGNGVHYFWILSKSYPRWPDQQTLRLMFSYWHHLVSSGVTDDPRLWPSIYFGKFFFGILKEIYRLFLTFQGKIIINTFTLAGLVSFVVENCVCLFNPFYKMLCTYNFQT